ncbi:small ribosomal subunit protein uS17c [Rhododendron vialii]|uniref:small ribosomal subunit protein uS17c n=1 Tax=Rhododendron vialii TaxID=182163 RepID=UPI00265F758E|nr:small ribosomal subunit protein uS17c [Rhododendron vialii]
MLLTQFKSLSLSKPSFHVSPPPPLSLLRKPSLSPPPPVGLRITNRKMMQGRVICDTNDKTVNVVVVRLAPHPKYHKRVRIKKKYQVHDPDNRFKVGDMIVLQKSRPFSKTKSFLALPVPPRNVRKPKEVAPAEEEEEEEEEIGIPLESQQS